MAFSSVGALALPLTPWFVLLLPSEMQPPYRDA